MLFLVGRGDWSSRKPLSHNFPRSHNEAAPDFEHFGLLLVIFDMARVSAAEAGHAARTLLDFDDDEE